MPAKPSIVFAHGLWADGSCFGKLIPALLAEGHDVMASRQDLDSLATDVAAVRACLARVRSPAILVGHSYGGTLITHAGIDPRVAGLVYIAALAPDTDETSQGQQDKVAKTDVFQHIDVTDGRIWLKASGIGCFCGDLPEAEQKLVYAMQGVPVADLFNQKVEGTAWKTKPSCYRRQPGPQGEPRAATLRRKAHEGDDDRSYIQPCADAFETGCGARGDPCGGEGRNRMTTGRSIRNAINRRGSSCGFSDQRQRHQSYSRC
jgi:pimeloyl-ACP methyl ester carboxylesterase